MPKDTTKPYTSSHRKLPYPSVCSSSVGAQQPTASSTHQDVASLIYDRHASASWPPDKDELLLKARQQGLNWQPIASQYFPEKSANACRKRHERLMEKRNNIDDWDISKMERLAKAYNDVREQMWGLLADRMGGEKWQVVESRVSSSPSSGDLMSDLNGSSHCTAIEHQSDAGFIVHGEGVEDSADGRPDSYSA